MFDREKGVLRNKILPFGLNAILAKVYKDKSWLDGKECIVLDYSDTSLVAQWIRDEIRAIGPGVYLGKVYWDDTRLIDFVLEFETSPPAPRQLTSLGRNGASMTPQETFLILAPVADGQLAALRALLASMTTRARLCRSRRTGSCPFGQLDRLHLARLFVVEVDTWRDIEAHGVEARPYPAAAGVSRRHRRRPGELPCRAGRAKAGDGLRRIFAHCKGFKPDVRPPRLAAGAATSRRPPTT